MMQTIKQDGTPRERGFKMPPEWHPHERCWMAWPCHMETWQTIGLEKARQAYAKVIHAIAQFEPVYLLVHPGDDDSVTRLCGEMVHPIHCHLNDSWTRDTGATFLLNAAGGLGGIDWIHNAWGGNYKNYLFDDQIARFMINKTHAQYFKAPFVMEGGSFHVDGEGTVLTTEECLLNPNRNPNLSREQIENYLNHYLGTNRIIWLPQGLAYDETDGHVDEVACFIEPGKVLCLITHDKNDLNYERLQENLTILKAAKDAQNRTLDVITIEQPPPTFIEGRRLTLSYINFYCANHGIVLPAFGYKKQDDAAYQLFCELFPNSRILQIDAMDIFAGGGGIHCITQQQPLSVI